MSQDIKDDTWIRSDLANPDLVLTYEQQVAVKHDNEKLRYDLLPTAPLHDLVKVLMFGAKKYGDFNWTKGFKWSRIYNSLKRHLDGDGKECKGWINGEDIDPESGLPHLAHIQCNAMFLAVFALTHPELDDRVKQ